MEKWINVNELVGILERSSGAARVHVKEIQASWSGHTREIVIGPGGVLNILLDISYPETEKEVKFR